MFTETQMLGLSFSLGGSSVCMVWGQPMVSVVESAACARGVRSRPAGTAPANTSRKANRMVCRRDTRRMRCLRNIAVLLLSRTTPTFASSRPTLAPMRFELPAPALPWAPLLHRSLTGWVAYRYYAAADIVYNPGRAARDRGGRIAMAGWGRIGKPDPLHGYEA